jgi:hypothetical protein
MPESRSADDITKPTGAKAPSPKLVRPKNVVIGVKFRAPSGTVVKVRLDRKATAISLLIVLGVPPRRPEGTQAAWRAVPARPRGEPGLDLGMLVGGVVVEDEVDLEVGRHGLPDRAQEAEELLVPVPRAALRQDGAVEQVEGGEQRGGAMAEVIVGHALDVAEAQRQQRLGTFERLDLAFLVETQDQRLVGRPQIQSNHRRAAFR